MHAVKSRLNTRLCNVIAAIKVENNLRMSVDRQSELDTYTEHRTFYFRVAIYLMMQNVLLCPITRKLFFISKDIQSL